MEVLFRCISIRSADPKPGKENETTHYTCRREARNDLFTLKKRSASNCDFDQKKQKPSTGSTTTYSSKITVKSFISINKNPP